MCSKCRCCFLFIQKRKIVLASRDEAATVDIKKVVRGSGQMRGLLGLAESKSTAGWGAGMVARSKNARSKAGFFTSSCKFLPNVL